VMAFFAARCLASGTILWFSLGRCAGRALGVSFFPQVPHGSLVVPLDQRRPFRVNMTPIALCVWTCGDGRNTTVGEMRDRAAMDRRGRSERASEGGLRRPLAHNVRNISDELVAMFSARRRRSHPELQFAGEDTLNLN
jgi:hypothetical protein